MMRATFSVVLAFILLGAAEARPETEAFRAFEAFDGTYRRDEVDAALATAPLVLPLSLRPSKKTVWPVWSATF